MPATWSRKRVLIKKIVLNSRLNRGDAIRAGHNALGACDMVHNMNFIVWTSYGCDMESILWTSICNMDHRNWLPEIGQGTGELHNASEATFIADLAVPYWYRRSYGKRNKKRKNFFTCFRIETERPIPGHPDHVNEFGFVCFLFHLVESLSTVVVLFSTVPIPPKSHSVFGTVELAPKFADKTPQNSHY